MAHPSLFRTLLPFNAKTGKPPSIKYLGWFVTSQKALGDSLARLLVLQLRAALGLWEAFVTLWEFPDVSQASALPMSSVEGRPNVRQTPCWAKDEERVSNHALQALHKGPTSQNQRWGLKRRRPPLAPKPCKLDRRLLVEALG